MKENTIDVCSLTEVDFSTNKEANDFKINDYVTLVPKNDVGDEKIRTVILVKNKQKKNHCKGQLDLMLRS